MSIVRSYLFCWWLAQCLVGFTCITSDLFWMMEVEVEMCADYFSIERFLDMFFIYFSSVCSSSALFSQNMSYILATERWESTVCMSCDSLLYSNVTPQQGMTVCDPAQTEHLLWQFFFLACLPCLITAGMPLASSLLAWKEMMRFWDTSRTFRYNFLHTLIFSLPLNR